MHRIKFALLFLCWLCISVSTFADVFPAGTQYTVCFTPGQQCTNKIVRVLGGAKHEIDVQVYSFTSKKIARALVAAIKRGVKVDVLYDASNFNPDRFSLAKYVTRAGGGCLVDSQVRIAHNKVMIVDGKTVITGSFNFSYAAQYKNAENVLIIHSPQLTESYLINFKRRKGLSEKCYF